MTVATTSTNEFTNGYIRSIFQTLTDKFTNGSGRRYITDRFYSVSIQAGNFFFGAQIPFVKPSAHGFFVFPTDIATECGITDKRESDGRIPSVKL